MNKILAQFGIKPFPGLPFKDKVNGNSIRGVIAKMTLLPGDYLVVQLPKDTSNRVRAETTMVFTQEFPNNRIILTSESIRLAILHLEKGEEPASVDASGGAH